MTSSRVIKPAPVFTIEYGPLFVGKKYRRYTHVCARNDEAAMRWLFDNFPIARDGDPPAITAVSSVLMGDSHWDVVDGTAHRDLPKPKTKRVNSPDFKKLAAGDES